MKIYIGSKIIQAEPMKKNDKEGYKVIYPPDGYVSWSPKNIFELCYREITDAEKKAVAAHPILV